jgi:hypothetical protein
MIAVENYFLLCHYNGCYPEKWSIGMRRGVNLR